jgi:tRNA(Arg) A34 adenosine deaminase TadA
MINYIPKRELMEIAIKEAIACRTFDEHPVGAVIVRGSEIISQSGNRTHRDIDPTHHAEVVVIGLASKKLCKKNLSDCILYTTHEPCPMCAAASVYARLGCIVFGTSINDAVRFVAENPHASWRSIGISLSTIIGHGDDTSLFVIEGFMKRQCASLFGLLLDGVSTASDLTKIPPGALPGYYPIGTSTSGNLNHDVHTLPHRWQRHPEERMQMGQE